MVHGILPLKTLTIRNGGGVYLETNNHTNAWQGFKTGRWNKNIDVREFIQLNYSLYEGDDEFLEGPTKATETLWDQVMQLSKEERERGGMWDMDTKSGIDNHFS